MITKSNDAPTSPTRKNDSPTHRNDSPTRENESPTRKDDDPTCKNNSDAPTCKDVAPTWKNQDPIDKWLPSKADMRSKISDSSDYSERLLDWNCELSMMFAERYEQQQRSGWSDENVREELNQIIPCYTKMLRILGDLKHAKNDEEREPHMPEYEELQKKLTDSLQHYRGLTTTHKPEPMHTGKQNL